MGKLTDFLRKITPKEIAPILPFAAMAVPGMGGIMSSSLAKFLVPQIMTAAGSARTSGKINPLNQILAGLGSASAIRNANVAASNAARSADVLKGPPSLTNPSNIPLAPEANFLDKASNWMADVPGVGKAMDVMGRGQEGIASIFSGNPEWSKAMFAPAAAGAGMYMTDAMTAASEKAKREQEASQAAFSGYQDSAMEMARAVARLSDPTNRYGNNPYGNFNPVTGQLLNKGGRVKYNMGTGNQGVQAQSGIPAAFDDPSDYAEYLIDPEAYKIKKYLEMAEEPIIMGPEDYNLGRANGGRIGYSEGGFEKRTNYNLGGLGSIPQTPTVPGGMQLDGRGGGFIPMGAQERRDDVPAMLAKNEFVMTSDAVRAAGGGDINKGAQKMYDVMNQLEAQV